MIEGQTTTATTTDNSIGSVNSRLEKLIDIPLHRKIILDLIGLFSYFDIYSPKIPILYKIVSYIRFFQLFGGAVKADSDFFYERGSLTYKILSIMSAFFHLVPAEYRDGNEHYVCIALCSFLIFFLIYLIIVGHIYSQKSKISYTSTCILSVFMMIFPFLLIPVIAEFAGLLLSKWFVNSPQIHGIQIFAVFLSIATVALYLFILLKTYTTTLIFRSMSFQSVEGIAQNKLIIGTTLITFMCALSLRLSRELTEVLLAVSLLVYVNIITTVFNCGTFTSLSHQTMVLGGSFFGIILCLVNMAIVIWAVKFKEWYFIGFFGLLFICILIAHLIIKWRCTKDLMILDEVDSLQDIKLIKSQGKFKQILVSGFNYSHPSCINYSLFKLAVNEWRDSLGIWANYAKYAAIYPENTNVLNFIAPNVFMFKTNKDLVDLVTKNIEHIVNTRETRLTPLLKDKVSHLQKEFQRAKNKLRNIWDLILQGSVNDMGPSISSAYDAVSECENEATHLMMLYPNNKFASRQHAKFLYDIKGDILSYKNAVDEINKLSRGYRVRPDTVHDLGMEAFPNIPDVIESQEASLKAMGIQEGESITVEETAVDDDATLESLNMISKQIQNHKIPAIRLMYSTSIFAYLLLVLLPLIALIVSFQSFRLELSLPLQYIQGIAFTRSIVNIMPAFFGKHLLQYMPDPNNSSQMILSGVPFLPSFTYHSYGEARNTRDICSFFAKSVTATNAMISPLRHFKYGNKHIEKVRDYLFTSNLDYFLYRNTTDYITSKASSIDISFMIAITIGRVIEVPNVTPELAKSSDSITARNNNGAITNALNSAMTEMVLYIQDNYAFYQKILTIIVIVLILLVIICYIVIFVLQFINLRKAKQIVVMRMTELPKTVISNISASFNKISSDGKNGGSSNSPVDAELTKQEESIIKIFSPISDNVNSDSSIVASVSFFFIVSCACIAFYLCITCFMHASEKVFYNCHHINYLYGSITFLYAIAARVFKIVLSQYHPIFKDTCINVTDELFNIDKIIPLQASYFLSVRIGGVGAKEVPFEGINEAMTEANKLLECPNPLEPPKNLQESIHCFTPPQQFYFVTSYYLRLSSQMHEDPPRWPSPNGDGINEAWQLGPVEMYEAFFSPTGIKLVPTITGTIDSQGSLMTVYVVVFAIITFLLTILHLFTINGEEVLIRFTLMQLLRCPPMVILGNANIMELLAGNYSLENEAGLEKHENFYTEVVNKLDEIILVCQEETGKIISVNASFETMFNLRNDEIIGKTTKEFFVPERFSYDSRLEKIFTQTTDVEFTKENGDKVFLKFLSTLVSGNRIYSGRNQTQNVMHERLIIDEKKKSDRMLASILPASLVSRVKAGEKNISFSVKSATVLFLDVVEFTPWCGSHDAQYVMRMLNIMFKEFDAITNAHKTMTKIKCIGDCYMAAGGIFDEINQPTVHAKEVVDFGCCAIKKLLEIDERENESLRIRVGVNTGGPIVSGVIGTEKPTFEILGPAINIAHEMEHHGVPMKVHISRPVYELIYGQQFDIKERGEIDVKNEKMFTYLVEP